MAAAVSSPQDINLRIHQDTSANTVYVSYGSKRYAIKVMQLNGSNTHEVTGLRDWSGVARIALDYLREELNNPFDFNRMKKVDIAFRGDVALNNTIHFLNPNSAVITNIRWSQTDQQPSEEIPLPAPRPEGLDKLRQLGIELATYRPLVPTPPAPSPQRPTIQPPAPPQPRPIPPLSPQRPTIQPPAPPQPNPPRPLPPQSGAALIHDAGGGGDCGPNSIAHQLSLMPGHNQKTPQQLRNEVFQYFDSDQVINDPRLCGYVLQSLEEEREENLRLNRRPFADALTITGAQAERDFRNFRNAAQLNLSEQESAVLLRRILNYRKERLRMNGVWVDKDFLYILGQLGTPIGVIRGNGNQFAIEERFPPDRPIDRNRTAWIYYNGTRENGGFHFQSFHRNRADFLQWINQLLLEDRNRAIEHLCEQIGHRRIRFNFGDPQERADALASIRLNVIDFRNKHPEVFARALNLMRQHNPALQFDAATFADINAHYGELLDNQYANIFTAQNLTNA